MNRNDALLTCETFSTRLRNTRIERGLSQQELADKVGLNKASISKYENNLSPPGMTNVIALADALHVSTLYLIGESDYPHLINVHKLGEVFEQLSQEKKEALYQYAQFLLTHCI